MKQAVKDVVMVTQINEADVIGFFIVSIFVFAVIFVLLENRNKPLK